ncbi:uncharacterized protein DSM5745_05162 [Aspergillus mulundensis]|uniref:Uncharacterized protein n=1 Tax=Aspergillus mulundensis TaxID=1810919 RepID=A0A3D8S5L4_9EURO|nr:hypothetical protein DSM5745_05162 [Aspergillus mulundensis]RDW81605.1 hypothetical protein DSM5745_05162 [Aspergillus mulundensis]
MYHRRITNIAVRDEFYGEDGPHIYYGPSDPRYIHATIAISTALDILNHPVTRGILTQMAMTHDNNKTHFNRFNGSKWFAARAVDMFLDKISRDFPVFTIDQNLTHPGCFAYHTRDPWQGTLESWNPTHDSISLNAAKFAAMLRSAHNRQAYMEWQFMFATVIVHEVGGHMLTTYLGNGGSDTPPAFAVPGYQDGQRAGEAGRFLETQLFGGALEWFVDVGEMDAERGFPFLISSDRHVRRIHPVVFSQITAGSYELNSPSFNPFPLTTTGPILMRRDLETIGSDIPLPPHIEFDLDYDMIAQQPDQESVDLDQDRRGYSVSTVSIREVDSDRGRNSEKQPRAPWSFKAKFAPLMGRIARATRDTQGLRLTSRKLQRS